MDKYLSVFLGAIAFLAMLGWLNEYMNNIQDNKVVMCQINQNNQTHIMPCTLVDSYLYNVEFSK